MPELNNIEELRKWFRSCPALLDSNRFRVNFLSENPTEYAIYATPSAITYHENVLGENVPDDEQTLNYIFASKESYGADVQTNLASMGFYDDVVQWVLDQNAQRNFPNINGGKVKSIFPTLTVFPAALGSDTAKYQIQLRLTYKRQA